MIELFIVCGAVAVLFGLAYLAACAGAGRWLTFAKWWGINPSAGGEAERG